ncbi:hypothetical protein BOX15_Mlig005822g1 [Macrostomum lignano]|uniref:Tyrosine-protein kinase ephrin type A/B receptor-like domain-containing protein n=1 Tax=Macrostomum lignano TaxID=282301 RepID=A0A267EZR6_9PLAT|nr:hypothetical protein BOX15_Mlig005822g1 [Macrostomum lignano]
MPACLAAVIVIALLGFQAEAATTNTSKSADADALGQHGPAVDSDKMTENMLNDPTQSTNSQATPTITKEILKDLLNEETQKAQSFNGISNHQPLGWVMTETVGGPDKEEDKMPVYVYPMGVGPLLMNECFQCRNVRVELKHSVGGRRVRTVQCLPECPAGHQLSDSKENLCVPCQPGNFKNTTGNHSCLPCAPGTFAASQASVKCTHCSPGTFAFKPGSAQCQQCPVGTRTRRLVNGSTSCEACSAGTFAAQRGQTECTPCPVGQFSNAEGQAQCQLCSAGFYSFWQGQTSCAACNSGISSVEGSKYCNNCKRGEFSPHYPDNVPCTKCPAGSSTLSAGSTSCIFCPEGSYSSGAGSASCSPCPRGLYQPLKNQTHCKRARPGWYVDSEGRSEQKMCPLGTISGAAASECTACPAGTFAKQLGSTNCTQCPPGSWSNAGSASCIACPSGTFAKPLGSTNCILCPLGSWSNAGSASCTACPAGSFAIQLGSTNCTLCPLGSWSSNAGSASCTTCPVGTFAKQLGSTNCTQCPAGTWSNAGSASCTTCPAGTFAKQGSTICTPCPAGGWSNAGSASCTECPDGTFASQPGSTNCNPCPAGTLTYSESSRDRFTSFIVCGPCWAGTYSREGESECKMCGPGRWSNAGSASCELCRPGTFQPYQSSNKCKDCPGGTYSNEYGSEFVESCKSCDLNFALSHRTGMTHCDTCPNYGSTFGTKRCYRKLRIEWCRGSDTKFFGGYGRVNTGGCVKTIDGNVNTYGGVWMKWSLAVSKTWIKYRLAKAETVKGAIIWCKNPYDDSFAEFLWIRVFKNGDQTGIYIWSQLDFRPGFEHAWAWADEPISNVIMIGVYSESLKPIRFNEIAIYGE